MNNHISYTEDDLKKHSLRRCNCLINGTLEAKSIEKQSFTFGKLKFFVHYRCKNCEKSIKLFYKHFLRSCFSDIISSLAFLYIFLNFFMGVDSYDTLINTIQEPPETLTSSIFILFFFFGPIVVIVTNIFYIFREIRNKRKFPALNYTGPTNQNSYKW